MMSPTFRTWLKIAVPFTAVAALGLVSWTPAASGDAAEPAAGRIDYLTFAQGAVPVQVGGAAAALGASFDKAMLAVDGDARGYALTLKPGDAGTMLEFVYELPSPTVFDRFAVPGVFETPSPSATFARQVEVYGSASGPDGEYVLLASGTLATHAARGQVTELTLHADTAVRWVKLRLTGGIQVSQPLSFLRVQRDHRQRHAGAGRTGRALHRRLARPRREDRARAGWSGRGRVL